MYRYAKFELFRKWKLIFVLYYTILIIPTVIAKLLLWICEKMNLRIAVWYCVYSKVECKLKK